MNEEIDKNYMLVKSILVLIICIFVTGFIIFFIGVARVEAAQYRYINNVNNNTGSWTNVSYGTEYTNSPVSLTSSGKSVFQFRDTDAFGTNKYDLILDFEYTITANGTYIPMASNNKPVDAFAYIAIEIYNGSTLKNISSQCTTNYSQTSTYPNDNQAIMTLNGTITCTAVDGQGYYPYFSFQARQTGRTPSPTSIAKIKFNSWTYRVNQAASDTNAIINSQNAGTQSIINNNNSNTDTIINNQNNNTNEITNAIDNINQVCNTYNLDKSALNEEGFFNNANGDLSYIQNWYHTSDYIRVNHNSTYTITFTYNPGTSRYCLYDENKNKIGDCVSYNSERTVTINTGNAYYIRYSGNVNSTYQTYFTGEYCYNAAEKEAEATEDIADALTDSSVDSSTGTSFFNDFNDTDHGGLSSIVTAPLNSINAMLSNSCTPISGSVYNKNFEIPCGTEMWSHLVALQDFLNLTLGGFICYNICRSLYLKIHQLKKPDDDRIEVMEL